MIHAEITVNDKNIDTYLCMSEDFKKIGENKAALDTFYEAEHLAHETPMEFCIRNGWEKYVYEMLVVDFLILNRDRHGANIEVLRNSEEKNAASGTNFRPWLIVAVQLSYRRSGRKI